MRTPGFAALNFGLTFGGRPGFAALKFGFAFGRPRGFAFGTIFGALKLGVAPCLTRWAILITGSADTGFATASALAVAGFTTAGAASALLTREGTTHRVVDLNLDEIFAAYVSGSIDDTTPATQQPAIVGEREA